MAVLTEATGMPGVEVLRPEIFKFRSLHGLGLLGVEEPYFESFFQLGQYVYLLALRMPSEAGIYNNCVASRIKRQESM